MPTNKFNINHLALGVGAFIAGSAYAQNKNAASKTSRTERDNPELAEIVADEISKILETWQPEDCESEDDFSSNLFEFLADNCDYELELYPTTRFGKPDILIEDILALELKINPNKAERDRLVGQCAGYSREWITWAVIIDSPPSSIGELERLLKDKGLEQILIWPFN